jgi:para-aminobenzoate synthetase
VRTLLVDNYDSYSYNLAELISRATGSDPIVVLNDDLSPEEALRLPIDCIVLSPGPGAPGNPRDIGISANLLQNSTLPILGVCLGHQSIAHGAGARVRRAEHPAHGILSKVTLTDDPLFKGIPSTIEVVRYHSLAVSLPLPANLAEIATATDGTVMAVRHTRRPQWGVQFHPEAVCTEHGEQLVRNFHDLVGRERTTPRPAARRLATTTGSQTTESGPEHPTLRLVEHEVGCQAAAPDIYEALYRGRGSSFWLDTNALRASHGWSFMGSLERSTDHVLTASRNVVTRTGHDGRRSVRHVESVWRHLGEELSRQKVAGDIESPFKGGYVGFFGYGLETELISAGRPAEQIPDLALQFCSRWIAIDHVANRVLVCAVFSETDHEQTEAWLEDIRRTLESLSASEASSASPPPSVSPDEIASFLSTTALDTREQYEDKVRACIEKIKDGETYEVCLTTGFKGAALQDPLAAYRVLRSVNPAPYSGYLDFGDFQVLSSSPERFLRVTPDRRAESKPIKGTCPRHEDSEADGLAAAELAADPKMRAENMMIVDLLRNDLNRVCEVGTVNVDSLMHVESYKTVHQLVSTISGRLAEGRTPLEAVESCFPGGSMTGAPKRRTMEIISDLEHHARGAYAGAMGLLSLDGYLDLSIVIRTIVNTPERWFVGAGGAVLINSDPAEEYFEMVQKASPPITALLMAGNAASKEAQNCEPY